MTNEEKMTPEEAIAEISFLKVAVNEVMEQALDMAIKALSQEPSTDAVSREAVLNLIEKGECLSNGAVKKLPSVTPQKSGKWIDYSDEGYVECPFCGYATTCEDNIGELHYCFYCGAEMESENE